ncbi:unnamed protein product [Ilex paraguariensis]|uniref:RRP15-like protein n=1 Tax=Ilex paraguariensis TaxID=185542 RepID=A0ABC8S3Q9_9AQUA
MQTQEVGKSPKKRKVGHKKGSKTKKKLKMLQGNGEEKVRINQKMKKLFRKRVRDYNSDDDDDSAPVIEDVSGQLNDKKEVSDGHSSDEERENHGDVGEENEVSEDDEIVIQPGITKFTEGCKAFRMAFKKITKTSVSDDVLGPVLSAHKKLVVEKLAEEDVKRKVKGEAKKEKHLVGEKGHAKPANFLDLYEKFLIGVATKGDFQFPMCIAGLSVVKLFNAVNKSQNAQKGLNPSRSNDAKAIRKQRKEAFFSELGNTSQFTRAPAKIAASTGPADGEGPAWAPLRDNYMLTNSMLKDWDKMPDTRVADDFGMPADSSSDDD